MKTRTIIPADSGGGGVTSPVSPGDGGFGLPQTQTDISTTGTINDLAITTGWLVFTGSSSTVLNGIVAQAGGTEVVITNKTNTVLQFAQEAAGSSAANRFTNAVPTTLQIAVGASARYKYNATLQRWNLAMGQGTVSSVGLTGPGGIFGVSGSPITSTGSLALSVSGLSGAIPYFSSTSVLTSSALLGNNFLMTGGGAGGAPKTIASLGTATTVLHGNASGAPTFGAVNLAFGADVTGALPFNNGGTGTTNFNLYTIPFSNGANLTFDTSFYYDFTNAVLNAPAFAIGSNFVINSSGDATVQGSFTMGGQNFHMGGGGQIIFDGSSGAIIDFNGGNGMMLSAVEMVVAGDQVDIHTGSSSMLFTADIVFSCSDFNVSSSTITFGAGSISMGAGSIGFFGGTPVGQPTSPGALSAGALWTSTEQGMLQAVYDAVRTLSLMS